MQITKRSWKKYVSAAAVLAVVLLVLVTLSKLRHFLPEGQDTLSSGGLAAGRSRAVTVHVTPAAIRAFEEVVSVYGSVEARDAATVSSRIGGTIDVLFVDEGDAVVAGKTGEMLRGQKRVTVIHFICFSTSASISEIEKGLET